MNYLVLSDLSFNLLYFHHFSSFMCICYCLSFCLFQKPSILFLPLFLQASPSLSLLLSPVWKFSPILISPCHFHSNAPTFSPSPFPPLLSQGANSLLLCSCWTAGNNGGVGLVVVATGMRWEGGERQEGRQWGRETKKKESRASTEGMLVVSWAAGKRAPANYTWVYAHRN